MKKVLFFALLLYITISINGQVSKTLSVSSGNLKTLLTLEELNNITNLTLTGTIDARDFRIMRDSMPVLSVLDISNASVTQYSGLNGTIYQSQYDYPANHIPINSFFVKYVLVSVNLPSSIVSIEDNAFLSCNALQSINLPANLTRIGNSVFQSCSALSSLVIPASVETIGYAAFSYCGGFSEIQIPASVTTIGDGAFSGFSGNINVSSSNATYSSIEGVLFDKSQKTLIQCPTSKTGHFQIPSTVEIIKYMSFSYCASFVSVEIPFSVNAIEGLAFYNCIGLTAVTIPSSVVSIGSGAFQNCTGLSSITVQYDPPLDFDGNTSVFEGVNKSACVLYVPFATSGLYSSASQWSDFISITELPEFKLSKKNLTVDEAGGPVNVELYTGLTWNALSDKSWLAVTPLSGSGNVTLTLTAEPNTSIGSRKALLTVSAPGVPSQYTVIEQQGVPVILNVTAGSLKSLFTEEELLTIESIILTGTIDARDFRTISYDMPAIKNVDLGGTTVMAYSGDGGTGNYWDYPANNLPDYAFSRGLSGNPTLCTVVLPSQITSIGYGAFGRCSAIESVTMPSTVTYIAKAAFLDCTGLESIELSQALVEIGEGAFMGCSSLTSITIPSSVQAINRVAFGGCIKLASINIPASVGYLGDNVFANRIDVDEANPYFSSSEGVLFNKFKTRLMHFPVNGTGKYNTPLSVTFIEANAFAGCSGLTAVNISSNVDTIGYWAFGNCSGLDTLILPPSIKYIEFSAFYNCTALMAVYSQSTIPAMLGYNYGIKVFVNVDFSNCVLYVPYGSSGIYAATDQWKDFINIVELPELKVSENKLSVPAAGDTIKIAVTTGLSWNIASDKSWLKLSPESGTGSDSITFTVEPNPTYVVRYAAATISATGVLPQTIIINQEKSAAPLNVSAGTLSSILSEEEKNQIQKLVLNGTIDARDFKTMRDEMPLLEEIDLSNVNIVEYTGSDGTMNYSYTYGADYIPGYAFYNPVSLKGKTILKSIKIPSSVIVIDSRSFFRCYMLESVNIPYSVLAFGAQAFMECVNLSSLEIPSQVEFIGEYAFASCSAIFNVASDNLYFSSVDGILYDKQKTLLIQCPISKTGVFYVPGTVTSIGNGAFANSGFYGIVLSGSSVTSIGHNAFVYCSYLMSISIPATVVSIGSYAFYGCSNLHSIYSYTDTPVDISGSEQVFGNVNKTTCMLSVPFGTADLYKAADHWKDFLNITERPGFNVSPASVTIPASGGNATAEVSSNITWTATSDKSWLNVSPSSGTGYNQTLTLTAESNLLQGTRLAAVTILDAVRNISKIIIVTQESPVPVKMAALANYPLLDNGNDITGNYGPMTLTNTPFQNGGIYCNGIYLYSGLPDPCDAQTPIINLNINSLFIDVDFMVAEKISQPVLVCGNSYRWLGVFLNSNGTVALFYNNANYLNSTLSYSLNQWHTARLYYDGSTARLYFDGELACSITAALNYAANDTRIGITNFASGKTFKGLLRNLKISQEVEDPVNEISDIGDSGINVYPNPAADYFVIDFINYQVYEGGLIKIISPLGNVVYSTSIDKPGYRFNTVQSFGKGVYILQIYDRNNIARATKKIVLE